MLLCEVLPRHRRGLGMYFYNIALSLGFLLSGLANMLLQQPAWGWRASVALLAAPGLLLAGLLPSISESPQVLLQHGKDAAAAQVRVLPLVAVRGKEGSLYWMLQTSRAQCGDVDLQAVHLQCSG